MQAIRSCICDLCRFEAPRRAEISPLSAVIMHRLTGTSSLDRVGYGQSTEVSVHMIDKLKIQIARHLVRTTHLLIQPKIQRYKGVEVLAAACSR